MKAICEGRKNRREVVQESLDQYRDVYLRVQQQLPVLHEVSLPMLGPIYGRLTVCRLFGNTSSDKTMDEDDRIDSQSLLLGNM